MFVIFSPLMERTVQQPAIRTSSEKNKLKPNIHIGNYHNGDHIIHFLNFI